MKKNVISAILALALIVSGIFTVPGNSTHIRIRDICGMSVRAESSEAGSSVHTVRVGFFYFPGYHEIVDDTVRAGYGVDFLTLLRRYVNVNYEYVGYENTWKEMQTMLENGEIDLVTSARKTPEREEKFAFSLPIGTSNTQLSVRADDDRYEVGDFEHFDGMVVGMLAGSTRNQDMAEFADDKGFSYTVKTYAGEAQLTKALEAGEVDAVVASSFRKASNERVVALFAPEDIYVIVRKEDTKLLQEINYGIEQMNLNEGDWKNSLYSKNYASVSSSELSFTLKELAYIQNVKSGIKTITATAQPDRDPYSFVEDGELTGIIPEYFAYLMEMVGLPYTVLTPKNREEYREWTTSGYVDVSMDCRYEHAESLDQNFGVITQSYMTLPMARVTRRDFNGQIQVVAGVEAQGSQPIEENIAQNAEYRMFSSREEALEAVRDGKADACYVYAYMAEKFVNRDVGGNLTYSILNAPVYNEYICVDSNTDHELASILNKCIAADTSHKLDEIIKKYTQYNVSEITVGQFLKLNPELTAALLAAAAGFVAAALLLVRNQKNAKRMAMERLAYAESLKSKNEELERSMKREEKANRAKSEFLFNMSHDIRTPMNAILGFTGLAQKHLDEPERMKDYLNKIHQSGDNLLDLINNVLTMSKIESGKSVINEEICSFTEILESTQVSFEELARQKNQNYLVSNTVVHDDIWTDKVKLRQIISNVISNAIKYTPQGGTVRVCASELPNETSKIEQSHKSHTCTSDRSSETDKTDKIVCIRIVVEDTGIGISPVFLPHIFEQFERERTATDSQIEGSGIGMAIVKKTVDQLGGNVEVESEQGKGTRVTITLYCRMADEWERAAATSQRQVTKEEKELVTGSIEHPRRILFAEDNDLNAQIAQELLEEDGFLAERAKDGAVCIEMLAKAPAGYYDLILMDIQMPNMNGYKATQLIRQLPDPMKANIPIIAMTANAFEEDKKKAFDAGMNGFVSKPVDTKQLYDVLKREVGK